jgi:thiol-disulfide isomerase/thioredoxin
MPHLPAASLSRRRLVAATTALALLTAACAGSTPGLTAPVSADPSSSTTGEPTPAPALVVTLLDGTPFNLAEHLSRDGRPVLLNLWASWCPPCRQEMPLFEDAARRHPEVLFLGVAVQDDAAAAAAAAAEMELTYPLAVDLDGAVDAAYPSPGLPATFLIGSDGTLIGAVYGGLGAEDIEGLVAQYLDG